MKLTLHPILPLALVVALAACANQSEPPSITAEPVFNKFGEIQECVGSGGLRYPPQTDRPDPCEPLDCPDPQQIPGTALVECPPPDDCPDGTFDTATGEYICPEPSRAQDRDDSSSSTSESRDPTGAPGTPGRP